MVDTDGALFDWDDANKDHIELHGVTREEAEDVLLSESRVLLQRRNESGESRWTYVGATEVGRVLVVVYVKRAAKFRVVTARRPTNREVQTWRRRRR